MCNTQTYSDPRPPFLDVDGATEKLGELGLAMSPRQVRRYFDERSIPWFRGPDGKRYVAANTLEEWLVNRQREAIHGGRKYK
ncbi:hypothetical protein [Rhodovibrio salinarum]|uniref:Helix-turn-helix domain-containing protein n=1 Tax=Rhodovibrio salinarum TaxID=1087 RepID=A0A934QDX8_9PROT|nr:hypothetical protein [Rhodovibrio salinarum]MBK1695647.1 hypothetical protein [Rhodovibrio salinarum]